MKSLGICIPAYKRPLLLEQCIVSAMSSANGKPIRIFISDDSGTKCNEEVVSRLAAIYSNIHICYNAKNIGIDANIQRAADMCDCDYLWLVGEDDRFLGKEVESIYNLIQDKDDDFIFSNYELVTEDFLVVLRRAVDDRENRYWPANKFLEEVLPWLGFIGSAIVSKAAWASTDAEPFLGTYFTHVGRVVDIISSKPAILMSGTPAVANRSQGDDTFTWKSDSFGVFLGFEKMCRIAALRNPMLSKTLDITIHNYRRDHSYLSLKTTFRLRSQEAYDLRQYKKYIVPADSISSARKTWLLFLALLPVSLVKPAAKMYKTLQ